MRERGRSQAADLWRLWCAVAGGRSGTGSQTGLGLAGDRPEITEHRLHRLTCSCCGRVTSAILPAGMPTCEAGPRLLSLVALLMSHYRCGKRKTAEFVRDVLNVLHFFMGRARRVGS